MINLTFVGSSCRQSKWLRCVKRAVDQAAVDLEIEKPDNIYIDAQAFAQRMVDSGVSEADLQTKMPEVAEAFVKAAEEGGDVVIPVAQFNQQLSGTAFGQALAGDVRLSQDDLSYNENLNIQDDIKKIQEDAVRELEEIKAGKFSEPEVEVDKDGKLTPAGKIAVFRKAEADRLFTELKASNPDLSDREARTQARAGAVMESSLLKITGMTPEQFEPFKVKVAAQNAGSAFNQKALDVKRAEEKLKNESELWASFVDGLASNPKRRVVVLSQTPLVMHLIGTEFGQLTASDHIFDGIFPEDADESKGRHIHREITKEVLKQLPVALTDPIAIFKSATDDNAIVMMLDINDEKGNTVVVPVGINLPIRRKGTGFLNLIRTTYGKDKREWFEEQITKGRSIYINNKKMREWRALNKKKTSVAMTAAGSNSPWGPLLALLDRSVKTEEDLVKLKEQYSGYYQETRGFFSPGANTITLTPNADLSTFSHEMGHYYLEPFLIFPGLRESLNRWSGTEMFFLTGLESNL